MMSIVTPFLIPLASNIPWEPMAPIGSWMPRAPGNAGRAGSLNASLRPGGSQPPSVILDAGGVVPAADAAVKQSLGMQQAPERPACLAATAGSSGGHPECGKSEISPHVRLSQSFLPSIVTQFGPVPGPSGNGMNCGCRGASPEGGYWVEYRCG